MKYGFLHKGLVFGLVGATFLAGLPLKTEAASAGALDPTFGSDGKVFTNVAGNDLADDLVIQPDGRIVVVGGTAASTGAGDFSVIRYHPNGTLDTTFDTDGVVTTGFGDNEAATSVALQTDGKIVVAGYTDVAGVNSFAVARYNPDGSRDNSFSDDGRVITDFGGSDTAQSVLIQADGKIVAGGIAGTAQNFDFGLARYNLDGTPDTTFSGDGRATIDFGGESNYALDMALQPDGKIYAAGIADGDFAIYRINPNGTADGTFDGDGIVTTNLDGTDVAQSIEIQTDGKIIAAGRADELQNSGLVRYNPDGSLDDTFDGDGRLIVDLDPSVPENLQEIKLQADGKILAAMRSSAGIYQGINAIRFNANGSLDLSFGGDGVITTAVQPGNATAAIEISGSDLLVLGEGTDVSLARFNLHITPTASNDFDGDGFSDYAIFRPSAGTWYIMQSLNGVVRIAGFGSNGDVPLDGDFDGDGLSDLAIYRPGAGEWWFQRSADSTVFAAQFGAPGDKPLPGDVDKDGKHDFIVWRPANGNYFVLRSSGNFASFFNFPFGANGDVPVGTAIFP